MQVTIRDVVFQVIKDESGVTTHIIAQRPDAAQPEFVSVAKTTLIYQVGFDLPVRDVFANEEGVVLADTLGCGKSTIWHIRRHLGVADAQTGASRTTRWRQQKTSERASGGEVLRYSRTPDASDGEEEEVT